MPLPKENSSPLAKRPAQQDETSEHTGGAWRNFFQSSRRLIAGAFAILSASPTVEHGQQSEALKHMGATDAAWHDFGRRSRRLAAGTLCALLVVFILWAAWAAVDEVTKGQGQVVPSQRLQVIQHLEGGILVEMLVKEGETVEPEQVLARVDNVTAASVMRDTQTRILEHAAAITRLEAELEGHEPTFAAELIKEAPQIVEAERSAWEKRRRQQEEEDNILDSQIEQRQQELQESISRQATFTDALNLAEQRERRVAPLVARKLHSEMDYLNLRQEAVRLRGEISAISNSIGKIESTIRETQQRKELSHATRNSDIISEINKRRSEQNSLKESFVAGSDRVTRTELRSPVKGIVNRILINTRGGIVKPGGDIMEIIPLDDTLVVEAKVRPADIAFIHPGQPAIVKITAYDYAIYGSLAAAVEQISADTFNTPQGEVYYLVKVRTKENAIRHGGRELPITPGMVASVDVLTGKKTILEYLLKPILRAREGALRER